VPDCWAAGVAFLRRGASDARTSLHSLRRRGQLAEWQLICDAGPRVQRPSVNDRRGMHMDVQLTLRGSNCRDAGKASLEHRRAE